MTKELIFAICGVIYFIGFLIRFAENVINGILKIYIKIDNSELSMKKLYKILDV